MYTVFFYILHEILFLSIFLMTIFYFKNIKTPIAVGRVRTYAGRAHWISSPTP